MLIAGYVSLGLLVGFILGATSAPITTTALGMIFVFAGSTAVFHITKAPSQQKLIGSILMAFSLSCLCASLMGATVKENHLLTIPRVLQRLEKVPEQHVYNPIFKSDEISQVKEIEQEYQNGDIKSDEAYQRLHDLLQRKGLQ